MTSGNESRRSMLGKLVTWACDRGHGWVSVSVTGACVTYCYPIGIPVARGLRSDHRTNL